MFDVIPKLFFLILVFVYSNGEEGLYVLAKPRTNRTTEMINVTTGEFNSSELKSKWDILFYTSIAVGTGAILLVIMVICCCCCPFCKFSNSKPSSDDNQRFRRSTSFRFDRSSFRFNRAAAPTAPLILEDEAESTPEATAVIQCLDTNDLLNTSEPIRYNPPAYSTLPTSGHRSIAVAPQTENCDSVGVNDLFFGPHDNIRLQRSDTTVTEYYDASTLER